MCIIHSKPWHTDEGHFAPPPPSLGPALCGLALPFGYLCAFGATAEPFGATAEPLHRLTEQKQFREVPPFPLWFRCRKAGSRLSCYEHWRYFFGRARSTPHESWQNRPLSVLFCLLMVRNLEGSVRCGPVALPLSHSLRGAPNLLRTTRTSTLETDPAARQ